MSARLRVLIITKIFPNAVEPLSSPFNRQQFAALSRRCDVSVMATIPWFPGAGLLRERSAAGRLTAVPRTDVVDGIEVLHPRYPFIPRIGHGLTGAFCTAALLPAVMRRRGRFDVLLGSWAYPDGVAAVALARLAGVASAIKLHGSDINVVARLSGPARNLRWALARAHRVVGVSRALAERAAELGTPRERLAVVRNGVDSALFHPQPRAAARAEFGLPRDGRVVLYVGRLEETKGVLDLLDAFERIAPAHRDLTLALLGDGEARVAVRERADRIGAQVVLAGARPLAEVPRWVAASDVVTLPSWNEGMPNALLEALACGRPVVATRVGGIPELITSEALGELVPAREPERLADALLRVASGAHDPAAIVAAAPGGWDESAAQLQGVLEAAVALHRGVAP